MVKLLLEAGANPNVQEKVRTKTAAVQGTLAYSYHSCFSVLADFINTTAACVEQVVLVAITLCQLVSFGMLVVIWNI